MGGTTELASGDGGGDDLKMLAKFGNPGGSVGPTPAVAGGDASPLDDDSLPESTSEGAPAVDAAAPIPQLGGNEGKDGGREYEDMGGKVGSAGPAVAAAGTD